MAKGWPFGTKRSFVSFWENDARTQQGKFRRYQRKSRKHAHARAAHPAALTAAPNCPTRFHLTHVALEYWAGGSLGKQREVLTYIREAVCFPRSRYLCRPASTASSLKRPGIPCHEIAVQNATSVEIAKNFYYKTTNDSQCQL